MNSPELRTSEPIIFLIDDEPSSFEVVSGVLHNFGCHLRYASNGISALKRLENSLPDVILLDVMMPELDGIEVCRRIKGNASWRHIPIIMITALNSKADLARCLDSGADDFLSKPISALELRARVRSMLRIKQQHDALKDSLELRADMANMVVHDLRNPLSSIALACDSLERAGLPTQHQARVARIKASEQKLRSLTESLLLMAKLESGKVVLSLEQINLKSLIKTCIDDFCAIAAQKKLQIFPEFLEPEVQVSADPLLLRRVLDNLLANAVKFSPSEGQVTVRVIRVGDGRIRMQVADQGVGISDDLKQWVFEKYETGTLIKSIPQLGLGLAFCRMAIEAHGGTISIENNQPAGTILSVEINSL